MTDLAHRMALHQGGQITWPEPLLGKSCLDCGHFAPTSTRPDGTIRGRCRLVRAHQKIDGIAFDGTNSQACPQIVPRGPTA